MFRLARPLRVSDASSDSPDPSGSRIQFPTRPTPQGLGRKFRLARPLRVSDSSSDSPDPLGSRNQVPSRPTPSRLGRRTPFHLESKTSTARHRTHDVTGTMTPIPQQGRVSTVPTTLGTAASPFSLCALTSFTVAYCLTVEREWGRLISITI
jgi:hypothetical protein